MYRTGLQQSLALADLVEEKKKAHDEQQRPKQPPSSTSKESLDDFDRVLYGGPSPACTPPTLDNIRTELKQSISYTGSKGRLSGSSSQRSPSYEVCLHTLWGESKSADGETRCSPQQDQIPSHGQGVERRGYTVVYTDETYVHTCHVVPKS